jgi:hypothetical protein
MGSTDSVAASPRRHTTRTRTVLAATLAMVLVAVAAACVPPTPTPTPNPFGLRANLADGAIELTWHAPEGTAPSGYDLQWRDDAMPAWENLPSTTSTSATFTEVENRTRYSFRVRATTPPGGTPAAWSPVAATWYVDLVLPVLRIDTNGAAPILDRENYVPGTVTLDPNGSSYAPYTGTMGVRGRGNSTWVYSKKPYRVKLDTKASLMGLPAERDWALLANAVDESQLRTFAAMQASEMTDLPYTPAVRHVEVVLNGQYNGVYVLTEHQEVGPDRVDITEMEEEDNSGVEVTGGYRLEIDFRLEENNEPGFRTSRNVPLVVKDPDPMTPQQRNYIRGFINDFEAALFGANFTDPVNGYRKFLDVDSFVDHYLVQELTRNQDVFAASTFFTKERGDDLLRSGPVWDFDRSMGTTGAMEGVDMGPEGFRARVRGVWPPRLFQDPALVEAVAERWHELRDQFATIPTMLLTTGADLRPAIENDLVRWHFPVNPGLQEEDTPEYLATWLTQRMAWLDAQYPDPTP